MVDYCENEKNLAQPGEVDEVDEQAEEADDYKRACSRACATAWVRLATPSLTKMLWMCFLTVPTVTMILTAISLFERPSLTRRKISAFAFAQRLNEILDGQVLRT